MSPYVLITAARNEGSFIEGTIQSVIAQSLPPREWIIVSDGSTDSTEDIVRRYAARHPFITLRCRPEQARRNFASKAVSLNEAYAALATRDHAYVGTLDGDVTLPAHYYETVVGKFEEDPTLGVAGGTVLDVYDGKSYRVRFREDSVRGAVQMFRRRCFEEIGGILPLKHGAVDTVAETMCAMRGWRVRTFFELEALHHRRTGTAGVTPTRAQFRAGVKDYTIGAHPLYAFAFCLGLLRKRPYIVGGVMRGLGYIWAGLRGEERAVPPEFVQYLRRQQLQRLGLMLRGVIPGVTSRQSRIDVDPYAG